MTVAHRGRWRGGEWRLSPCLISMEAEADRIAPERSIASDGSIGDAAHAARRSDHNPDEEGATDWVDALDITHDPENGMDIHARLREVARNVVNGVEDRVDYLISNGQIFSRRGGKWAWRPYSGSNPHRTHGHISVKDGPTRHDTSPWFSSVPPFPTKPVPPPYTPPPASLIRRKPMYLLQARGDKRIWLTDGMTRRHVTHPDFVRAHQRQLKRLGLPTDVVVESTEFVNSIRPV